MNKEIIIINDEPFYRIQNGTGYDYAPIPKQFKPYFEKLQQENKQLKSLINTILNFSFFKEECPLNFGFEDNSKEDKAQNIFYSDEYCENNCNDSYKDCWLKYFKKLQELEQGSNNDE